MLGWDHVGELIVGVVGLLTGSSCHHFWGWHVLHVGTTGLRAEGSAKMRLPCLLNVLLPGLFR